MKKKVLAVLMTGALALGLAACGGSGNSGSTAASSSGSTATSSAPETSAAAAETVDVGDFTVDVPAGWMGFVQTDLFGEKDEDGNYPVRTDAYGMIKGGESEWDAFSKPSVYVYYYPNSDAQTQSEGTAYFYTTTDLDVTVGGTKCTAFHAMMGDPEDEESTVYEYDYIFIPVTDSSCFQVQMMTSSDGEETGIGATDSDVVAIMESLKVK